MVPPVLVFDLDGTLVDSLGDLTEALARLLAAAGRRSLGEDEVRGMVGRGARVLIDRAWRRTGAPAGEALDGLYTRFLDHYDGLCTDRTRPYPGVVPTLAALRDAGHPLALCTNKPIGPTRTVLGATGLAAFFPVVLGGDSRPYKKPDPRHLHACLRALHLPDAPAVLVGDSPVDVEAARAAGWPVIAVAWGYAQGDPADLGADVLLHRFTDLPATLAALFPADAVASPISPEGSP